MNTFNPALFWARSEVRSSNRTGFFKGRSMARLNKARSQHKALRIDLEVTICGIPAGIQLDHYSRGTNLPINSASLEPNDPPELEYTVTDRKGYRADWLVERAERLGVDLDLIVMAQLGDKR